MSKEEMVTILEDLIREQRIRVLIEPIQTDKAYHRAMANGLRLGLLTLKREWSEEVIWVG